MATRKLTNVQVEDIARLLVGQFNKITEDSHHGLFFTFPNFLFNLHKILKTKDGTKTEIATNRRDWINRRTKSNASIVTEMFKKKKQKMNSKNPKDNPSVFIYMVCESNLDELSRMKKGDFSNRPKPVDLNHGCVIIFDLMYKFVYVLDSMASNVMTDTWKEIIHNWIYSDAFKKGFSEIYEIGGVMNEDWEMWISQIPIQEKPLCFQYVLWFITQFGKAEYDPEDFTKSQECNDKYIGGKYTDYLMSVIKQINKK